MGRVHMAALLVCAALGCGGAARAGRAAGPEASGPCPDPAPLYALAFENLGDHPALGLPSVELPEECDDACRRDAEARLGLEDGALVSCAGDVCAPSWYARLVHVRPPEAGACAVGVVRAELSWETPIGIGVPLASRTLAVAIAGGGALRLDATLGEEERAVRAGATFGDLDGDGRADWLRLREMASERCFGTTFDTNECQGFGVPASRVVEVRGARGRLAPALAFFGPVLTPELTAALDRIADHVEACRDDETDDCLEEQELGVRWTGRRTAGAPVARRVEGGFAVDQVIEEVECDEACVTPLGDVCTERPDEEYGVSSERCRSRGWMLESALVRGDAVERVTRPLESGVFARVRCTGGCSMEAALHPLGDGDPSLHRAEVAWPSHVWPVWRSEGGVLALPTGVFALRVLRTPEGPAETWLVAIDAEHEELSVDR